MTSHRQGYPSVFPSNGVAGRRTPARLAVLVLLALLLAACSGGASAPPATGAPASAAPTQAAASAPAGPAPVGTAASPTAGPATASATAASTVASVAAGAQPAATPGATQGAPAIKGSLTVFAAASLTDAFKEMKTAIERANPGATVTYSFAGSPTLRTQLDQGASADVFASADQQNMQGAQQDGTIAGQPRVFAQNKLSVIVPSANPGRVSSVHELSKPGLKLVLAQKDVPVGRYARETLTKLSADPSYGAGYSAEVLANLKSEEANVKNVVAKVQLGEADAGIVYRTDVTPSVRAAVAIIDIPDQFNVIAQYPIAGVKHARNEAGAQAFIDYVLSPAGQSILATYGFAPAPAQAAADSQSGAPGSGGARGGAGALGGQVARPGNLTATALQKLPSEAVRVTFLSGAGQEQQSFTGARLATVAQQAGRRLDPSRKNHTLRQGVVATGRGGCEVVVARRAPDPEFANAPILLAWADNGRPTSTLDGPIRLVVPTDGHGGRDVSGLAPRDVRAAEASVS